MIKIECPKCKSEEVEVPLSFDAKGQLRETETVGKCKAYGYQLSLKEIRAALSLN